MKRVKKPHYVGAIGAELMVTELPTKPVRIYRNLHRKCYSVQQKDHRGVWLVVAHCDEFRIAHADFVVSKAGHRRVFRERRKNVHAYIIGMLTSDADYLANVTISYNPYVASFFTSLPLAPTAHCGTCYQYLQVGIEGPRAPIHKASFVEAYMTYKGAHRIGAEV